MSLKLEMFLLIAHLIFSASKDSRSNAGHKIFILSSSVDPPWVNGNKIEALIEEMKHAELRRCDLKSRGGKD